MNTEKYNGYTNFETWRLCLNLDNDQGLYSQFYNYTGTEEELKRELEDCFQVESKGDIVGYHICDFWSTSEWESIDWEEVLETRQDEEGGDAE